MDAIIMRDKGLDKGLVHEFNTSDRDKRGWSKGFFGFRKMFWDYLKKLNVPFYDPCCPAASEGGDNYSAVRYNTDEGRMEYFNGTEWTDVTAFTTTSTTTTTTEAPTTTTTTTTSSTTTTTTTP